MTLGQALSKAAASGGKLRVYRNKSLPGGYGTLDVATARAKERRRDRQARNAWHAARYYEGRRRAGLCVGCGRRRPRRDRLQCRPCAISQAHRVRASKYGITPADYRALHRQQRDRCFTCRRRLNARGVVDHCHKTGRVRGLLCGRCNVAEGLLKRANLVAWAARILALREEAPVAAVVLGGSRTVRVRGWK